MPAVSSAEQQPSPEVRADQWLADRRPQFVESDNGGITMGGRTGYMSGGPGASAESIYHTLRTPELAAMRYRNPANANYPLDADDFGRCLVLLDAVPEWRHRLDEVANVSSRWAGLVGNWDRLEEAVRSDNPDATKLIRAAMDHELQPERPVSLTRQALKLLS